MEYVERRYRSRMGRDAVTFTVSHRESDLWVAVDRGDAAAMAARTRRFLGELRRRLDDYLARDPALSPRPQSLSAAARRPASAARVAAAAATAGTAVECRGRARGPARRGACCGVNSAWRGRRRERRRHLRRRAASARRGALRRHVAPLGAGGAPPSGRHAPAGHLHLVGHRRAVAQLRPRRRRDDRLPRRAARRQLRHGLCQSASARRPTSARRRRACAEPDILGAMAVLGERLAVGGRFELRLFDATQIF